VKVIIDFDGTLTAEETQARPLAARSLDTLASEILCVPRLRLEAEYEETRAQLLQAPHLYGWKVRGLLTSYCDEGAFILNTSTLQALLSENPAYAEAVAAAFPRAEYDPVADCINYLFHRHTAELPPAFRPGAGALLEALSSRDGCQPLILTNSLGDKVLRLLETLHLAARVSVLGDTRQYDMDPTWAHHFRHPLLGDIQVWPVSAERSVDLRRPVYHHALLQAAADGSNLAVVADTFSLPGALPLLMGIPFFLLRTSYTPDWCAQVVSDHPLGRVLGDLAELPSALESLRAVDILPVLR